MSVTVQSQALGFPSAYCYAMTTVSNNLSGIVNQLTSFYPGAIKSVRGGLLYGFLGGNVTSYTSFFVLPNANPSQGRITITIYDIAGREICQGGFDVTVQ
jgi:hypothetical protein